MPANLSLLIKTITAYHRQVGLPDPVHPLVSLLRFEDFKYEADHAPQAIVNNFYSIALKRSFHSVMRYGQQEADFDAGIMMFVAPMQVIGITAPTEKVVNHTGWLLLVHPDLLWNTSLAAKIRKYEYFSYQINEALHLSEQEEKMIVDIMQNIEREYQARIDNLSQDVMVAQLDLMLTYAERYYQRQFITRRSSSHHILAEMESYLDQYYTNNNFQSTRIPSVTDLAEALHLSPNYLSRLLKTLTGQSTKQFIMDKVIELAKEKLSTTNLSMNEIAYALGFEHAQSFSKMFKSNTTLSPLEFRQSFKGK